MTWSWQGNRPQTFFGLVVLAALVVYYGFLAVDSLSLPTRSAAATVAAKGYRAGGETYYTVVLGNSTLVRPRATPEVYLLKLVIDGQEVEGAVPKDLHTAVTQGDSVRVEYQRTRLTGAFRILAVHR
jgi:hypothetical protein